jgi:hypothetical protein
MEKSNKEQILEAFDQGNVYVQLSDGHEGEYRFAFPRGKEWNPNINNEKEEAQEIAKYFDNVTVFIFTSHLEIWDEILCPKEKRSSRMYDWSPSKTNQLYVIDGEVYEKNHTCNDCKHFLKSMVGECTKDERELMPGKEVEETKKLPAFDQLMEIKRGYIKEYEFSKNVIFTRKHIEGQIDYYRYRGKKARERNHIRKNVCIGKNCLKYKTETCPKGWRGHSETDVCFLDKKTMMDILKKPLLEDFGSFKNAYWYFSQCGQGINIKDPITKRYSARLIATPAEKNGGTKANGFFLALPRYPYGYGDYHRKIRWRYSQSPQGGTTTRITKHDSFLPVKKFKKEFPGLVKEATYNEKKHEELVYAIYALYKILEITPGKSRYLYKTNSEYDISISIAGDAGRYQYGNSTGRGSGAINNLHHIFDYFDIGIKKLKEYKK